MDWTFSVRTTIVLLVPETDADSRIARLREQRGISQEELAQRARVSVKTISRLERGQHSGRPGTLNRVAEALGVDRTELGAGLEAEDVRSVESMLLDIVHRLDGIEEALKALAPLGAAGQELVDATRATRDALAGPAGEPKRRAARGTPREEGESQGSAPARPAGKRRSGRARAQ